MLRGIICGYIGHGLLHIQARTWQPSVRGEREITLTSYYQLNAELEGKAPFRACNVSSKGVLKNRLPVSICISFSGVSDMKMY
jgi:hypothetical protein